MKPLVESTKILQEIFSSDPEAIKARQERHEKWVAENLHRKRKLEELLGTVNLALGMHIDNCGGDCRHDLVGHDCCNICNMAEALAASYELIAKVYT